MRFTIGQDYAHPEMGALPVVLDNLIANGVIRPVMAVFIVENTRQLHNTLQEKGYPVLFLETADGHSWGNWRGVMDDVLRFFFEVEQQGRAWLPTKLMSLRNLPIHRQTSTIRCVPCKT